MPLTLAGEMSSEEYAKLPQWVQLLTAEAMSLLSPADLLMLKKNVWKSGINGSTG